MSKWKNIIKRIDSIPFNYFNGFSRKFLFCNTYIQNNLIYIFFILKNKNIKYVIVVLTYLQVI